MNLKCAIGIIFSICLIGPMKFTLFAEQSAAVKGYHEREDLLVAVHQTNPYHIIEFTQYRTAGSNVIIAR